MLNTIILASHGELAQGLKHTTEMIVGETNNIYALSAYRDEDKPIEKQLEPLINTIDTHHLFILTDILGGSVNNEMLSIVKKYPEIQLITGMNLPLVISIATQLGAISENLLASLIEESKQSVINCSLLLKNNEEQGGDDL